MNERLNRALEKGKENNMVVVYQKDESIHFVPAKVHEAALTVKDRVSRVLAIGAIIFSASGAAIGATQFLSDANDKRRIGILETNAELNLSGDCINENILREALGYERVELEACQEERNAWIKTWEAKNGPTATPEPRPLPKPKP